MSLRFQNFPIYQELRHFISEIYQLSKKLPKHEQYELASQLRRAATSGLLNIAEGSMKKLDKEFNRYLLISIGSISDIVSILDICIDLKYISTSTHQTYLLECESIIKKLYGFSNKLKDNK